MVRLHFGRIGSFDRDLIFCRPKNEPRSEMNPYGSVGAHIKTGGSPMAQDHFKTPPDPKRGCKNHENPKTILKAVPNQPRIALRAVGITNNYVCLLYTSPSPRDRG